MCSHIMKNKLMEIGRDNTVNNNVWVHLQNIKIKNIPSELYELWGYTGYIILIAAHRQSAFKEWQNKPGIQMLFLMLKLHSNLCAAGLL